jgi:hypothetical protein
VSKEKIDIIKPSKDLTSGHYHEYSERSYLAGNIMEEILIKHSVYEQHPQIKEVVGEIISDVANLYQLSGYLLHKKIEAEELSDNQNDEKS